MKVLFYSTKNFEHPYLKAANNDKYEVEFYEGALSAETVYLSKGYDCISIFTADDASADVIEKLYENGVKYIAMRSAGYDNVDTVKAAELGIKIANVPAYSPYAIAEYAVAMVLAMNRKIALANEQVHRYDFTLQRLVGFDLHNKTVGIIGTGRIGEIVVKIMHGFGCKLLGFDINRSSKLEKDYNLEYTGLERLCEESDIITIHTPLNDKTKYLVNAQLLKKMKPGVMLVNTSRGGIVNTGDLLTYLENGKIGYYGMDVYEKERGIFFYDHQGKEIEDEMLKKLLAMPNVLVTPHQAFATSEALSNIAGTTFYNITKWAENKVTENEICSAIIEKSRSAITF